MVVRQPRSRTLTEDGFATPTALLAPAGPVTPTPADPLALPPDRDDDAPQDGPWLDDPSYEVAAWLLGLARRIPVQP